MKKIACIGTGAMGGAIMRAVCNKFDPNNITVSNRTLEKGKSFANDTGCRFADNNKDCIKDAKYIGELQVFHQRDRSRTPQRYLHQFRGR